MERHFTATVYVVEDQRILLLYHPKLLKWLPPGGHLEVNETPAECARREVLEETGLVIELIKEEHIWIDRPNAVSCERPLMCLIENIPAHGKTAFHQHIDFLFIGQPRSGAITGSLSQLRWFTLEEVMELKPEEEIFAETQETIREVILSKKDRKK